MSIFEWPHKAGFTVEGSLFCFSLVIKDPGVVGTYCDWFWGTSITRVCECVQQAEMLTIIFEYLALSFDISHVDSLDICFWVLKRTFSMRVSTPRVIIEKKKNNFQRCTLILRPVYNATVLAVNFFAAYSIYNLKCSP